MKDFGWDDHKLNKVVVSLKEKLLELRVGGVEVFSPEIGLWKPISGLNKSLLINRFLGLIIFLLT